MKRMLDSHSTSYDSDVEELVKKDCARFNSREVNGDGVYNCPSCGNKGWRMEYNEKLVIGELHKCDCHSIRESDLNINRSGLNEVFKQMKFNNWDKSTATTRTMFELANKFVTNFTGSEWFYAGGQVGSGKTHICTALFQELMKNSYVGTYKRWHEILKQLKSEMNTKDYNITMNELKNCQMLYIDDFLKNASESDMNIAFEIIQGRVDRQKSTIISSELYLNEIKDEAIYSRIKQMCGEYYLSIKRTSLNNYRLKGERYENE